MDLLRSDLLDAQNDARPEEIPASVAAEERFSTLPRGACAQSAGLSLHQETSYATVDATN